MAKEWVVSEEDLGCDGAYFSYTEVVRCRNCKWHNTTVHEKCVAYDAFWVTDPDDYCAWGERREDD